MTPKFDLMKELRKREKEEKLKFEGAIIAFQFPDGKTGATTFCNELGVGLRLINEGKVQERVLEIQNNDIASKQVLNSLSNQKIEKKTTMFG